MTRHPLKGQGGLLPSLGDVVSLGLAWSRIIVCFVVLSVSGRGGLGGRNDFGPCLLAGVGVEGLVVGAVVGVGVGCVVFPWRRQVTGMNAEVAEV